MDTKLSSRERAAYLKDMSEVKLDLLIIGGGITGAGIAWDASSRGMVTGLVEMNDFASGTSSRSTKLIHGGLRYLKQGEIKLVREVGSERALLHKSAPHLVDPIPMLLPIYKNGTYGYWTSSIGLLIYDWLAGVKGSERRKMYGRDDAVILEPLFKQDGLKGAGYYYEYRTDDARLTIEVLKSARASGAMMTNYTKATAFIYRGGRVVGVKAEDLLSGDIYSIYAKKIVNAAGPWVDEIRTQDNSLKGKRLLLTKGVHLVVDYNKVPVKQAAYFDVPGGRMIFVIPRGKKTYIGTTDTVYEGDIQNPGITEADRKYLLDAVNHAFPDVQLCLTDIETAWSGLRPLVREEGKGPSEISRKDELFVSHSGLITIAGGKLTGFRKMGEKVVNLVSKQLQDEEGTIFPPCTTDRKPISGGLMNGGTYHDLKKAMVKQGRSFGINIDETFDLMSRYGANTLEIFRYIDESKRDEMMEDGLLYAEIKYSIDHEMTLNAVDFLLRRTGWLLFDRQRAERIVGEVVSIMTELLEWDGHELDRQWLMLQEQVKIAWNTNEDIRVDLNVAGKSVKDNQTELRSPGFLHNFL
ncbi:glycerol-3-phosphate dehydrogenase/oxidase [Paenibacillus dakarensis]|uniref:glycerol-3-phosphate dehydrogenase/oxidase n=1 Tax=Paenibacillus dakarensis TaxID=1527293 RepID=UPI0009E9F4CB|nr:glycerol-3-phosphate dehydrogenase/oxidase [Paenibacillus dakarensis]